VPRARALEGDAVEQFLPSDDQWSMLLRLVSAMLAGAAIGWNRHRAGKPAGLGTHVLVALGAGLFVAVPASAGGAHLDALSRAIQGVATGVGFLGAGEIFRDPGPGSRVHGLTSAAALWVTAALGLVIVSGSMFEAVSAVILVLAVLEIAPRIERRVPVRPDGDSPTGGSSAPSA
jgi:putative Mg2+ transporter-C (MgtC) family protein